MGTVIITLKVMPESPDVDLEQLKGAMEPLIEAHGAVLAKEEVHPVAFGLNALHLIITMDESKGTTDELEEKITALEHIQSVQVIDVRRSL